MPCEWTGQHRGHAGVKHQNTEEQMGPEEWHSSPGGQRTWSQVFKILTEVLDGEF